MFLNKNENLGICDVVHLHLERVPELTWKGKNEMVVVVQDRNQFKTGIKYE